MCLAIVIPANVEVPEVIIRTAAKRNVDGCGFAYVNDGPAKSVVTIKRWGTSRDDDLNSMISSYKRTLRKTGANKHPMLMHFRIATSGVVNKDNAHPFPIIGGALVHNGSFFSPAGGRQAARSDTRMFAEAYKNKLTTQFVDLCARDIEEAIGSWNKVAMLWSDGTVRVLNEKYWVRDAATGLLFSHGGYKP